MIVAYMMIAIVAYAITAIMIQSYNNTVHGKFSQSKLLPFYNKMHNFKTYNEDDYMAGTIGITLSTLILVVFTGVFLPKIALAMMIMTIVYKTIITIGRIIKQQNEPKIKRTSSCEIDRARARYYKGILPTEQTNECKL